MNTAGDPSGSGSAAPSVAGLSEAKRRALVELLMRRQADATIPVVPRDGLLAPSYQQEGMWFLCQLNPDSAAVYNIPFTLHIHGRLDLDALNRALHTLINRHEGFRTRFVERDGVPWQQIDPVSATSPLALRLVDISAAPDPFARAIEIAEEDGRTPFDLSEPLIRGSLLQLGENEQMLLLTVYHIVTDGWSLSIFASELNQLYTAELTGVPADLPELRIQPADFAAWQRRQLSKGGLERQLDYWRETLTGLPTLDFPTDRPRPISRTWAGDGLNWEIPADLGGALQRLARQESSSLLATLIAGFTVVLARYTGQDDIAVGSVFSGRSRPEVEPLVGYFVNTAVLRVDTTANPTFRELLARCHDRVLSAIENQDVPFSMVVNAIRPERDASRNPLFQVSLTLQPYGATTAGFDFPGAQTKPLTLSTSSSRFDITTTAIQNADDSFLLQLEYATELFDADRMERLLDHFLRVLRQVVADPQLRLGEIELCSPAERAALVEFNRTRVDLDHERCLHDLVAAQVARTPDAVAVRCEGAELTFAELDARANQLAHYLAERGVGPGVLVGVSAYRSVELVVALLGILKAGGAYVPLDPDYPPQRLEFMVADTDARVVLTQDAVADRLPVPAARLLRLDRDWATVAGYPTTAPTTAVTPADLAYVLYTSGSTGNPKGVMLEHRAVANRLLWLQSIRPLGPDDVLLQKTPYTFDVSVPEFFWPLLTGARMVLARPEGHRDNDYLVELINAERVTSVHFVPSMLSHFLDQRGDARLPSVRRVYCSGEALSGGLRDRFYQVFDAELYNLYGPTEAAVEATWWACAPEQTEVMVPIGRPIANVTCHVLDTFGQPVPLGVTGELHLGGVGLARGYLHRPELTTEKFIPDPFSTAPGARLYRTGDLVRRRADGALEYLGRNDNQVKINGLRIELGEIEYRLRQHPAVSEAAVVVHTPPHGGSGFLCAYLVTPDDDPDLGGQLRKYLGESLPQYMIPIAFTRLEQIPTTANGKLDQRRLPAPSTAPAERQPPTSATELALADIWHDLLKIPNDELDLEHNFFLIGGNSLQAIQVTSRIRDAFGVTLNLRQFFTTAKLGPLAALVDETIAAKLAEEDAERARIEAELAGLSEEELDRLLEAESR